MPSTEPTPFELRMWTITQIIEHVARMDSDGADAHGVLTWLLQNQMRLANGPAPKRIRNRAKSPTADLPLEANDAR